MEAVRKGGKSGILKPSVKRPGRSPTTLFPAPAEMTRANDAARRAVSPAPATPEAPGAAAMGPPALLPGMPPPVPARARRGRLSSKFGTVNYSVDEMRRLNEKVRAVLPVSADEWLHVAYQFNYLRPDSIPYREVESLKRKFKKMYCARGGGNSNSSSNNYSNADAGAALPDYLVEAKALRQLINQRSDKAQSEDAQSDLGAAAEDPAMDHAGIGGGGGGDGSSSQAGVEEDAGQSSGDAGRNATTSAPATSGSHGATADSEGRPTTMLLADALRDDGAGGDALAMGRAEPQELRHLRVHSSAAGGHQHQQQHALELPVDGLADGGGSLASRLRQMEEDYQRSVLSTDSSNKHAMRGSEGNVSVASDLPGTSQQSPTLATTPTASSTSELHSPTAASAVAAHQALVPPGVPLSTTGIISMLKHSIERKRRTVEEQVLHESVRVRKERKKRKMEQALYSIHQEQRERESSSAAPTLGAAAAASTGSEARLPPSPSHHSGATASGGLSHPLFQSPTSSILSGTNVADASSLGLMEIMLQYMTAQQLETARRHELEEERRRREELAREERRCLKDQQRRRQHQELMLALSALLGDKFPPSLRHLVDAAPTESVDERGEAEAPSSLIESASTRGGGESGASGDQERDAVDPNAQPTGAVEDGASVLL